MPGLLESTLQTGYGYLDPYVEKARGVVPLIDRAAKTVEVYVPPLITRVDEFAEPQIEKMKPFVEPRIEQVRDLMNPRFEQVKEAVSPYYTAGMSRVSKAKEFKDAKVNQVMEFKEAKANQVKEFKEARVEEIKEVMQLPQQGSHTCQKKAFHAFGSAVLTIMMKIQNLVVLLWSHIVGVREFKEARVEDIKEVMQLPQQGSHTCQKKAFHAFGTGVLTMMMKIQTVVVVLWSHIVGVSDQLKVKLQSYLEKVYTKIQPILIIVEDRTSLVKDHVIVKVDYVKAQSTKVLAPKPLKLVKGYAQKVQIWARQKKAPARAFVSKWLPVVVTVGEKIVGKRRTQVVISTLCNLATKAWEAMLEAGSPEKTTNGADIEALMREYGTSEEETRKVLEARIIQEVRKELEKEHRSLDQSEDQLETASDPSDFLSPRSIDASASSRFAEVQMDSAIRSQDENDTPNGTYFKKSGGWQHMGHSKFDKTPPPSDATGSSQGHSDEFASPRTSEGQIEEQ